MRFHQSTKRSIYNENGQYQSMRLFSHLLKRRKHVYSIDEIADTISPIAQAYGVDTIYLYGSYARGDADGDSDIDLLIIPGQARGMALGGLHNDIRLALDRNVDIITNHADPRFLNMISNELVQIYGC